MTEERKKKVKKGKKSKRTYNKPQQFFKIKGKDTKETGFVGANVPLPVSEYMSLLCVADAKSKSSLIQDILNEWYETAVKAVSPKKLENIIAERGIAEFHNRKRKTQTFNYVIDHQERALVKRGLGKEHIASIIKKITDGKGKKKKQ